MNILLSFGKSTAKTRSVFWCPKCRSPFRVVQGMVKKRWIQGDSVPRPKKALRNQCRKDATMENGTDLVIGFFEWHNPGDFTIFQVTDKLGKYRLSIWGEVLQESHDISVQTQVVPIFFINQLSIRTFRGSCLSPLLFAVIYQVELEPPLLFLLWMEPYQGICRDKGFISQHAISCLLFSIVVSVFVSGLGLCWAEFLFFGLFSWWACLGVVWSHDRCCQAVVWVLCGVVWCCVVLCGVVWCCVG